MIKLALIAWSCATVINAELLDPLDHSCKISSEDFNACLKNYIKAAFRLVIVPDGDVNYPDFDFKVMDYNLTGFDAFEALHVEADVKNNVVKVAAVLPYCEGKGSYKMKGQIYDTFFDTAGHVGAFGTTILLNYAAKTEVVERDGNSYLKVISQDIKIRDPDDTFYLQLDNLIPGSLRESVIMNKVLNEHSADLFALLIPIVESGFNRVLEKFIGNIEIDNNNY